jgi:hypothetical protein
MFIGFHHRRHHKHPHRFHPLPNFTCVLRNCYFYGCFLVDFYSKCTTGFVVPKFYFYLINIYKNMVAISRKMKFRTHRRSRVGGRRPTSVCSSLKSSSDCSDDTRCKWNAKLSKCRKAYVKYGPTKRQAEKMLNCAVHTTKEECSKDKCLWGDFGSLKFCTSFAPKKYRL